MRRIKELPDHPDFGAVLEINAVVHVHTASVLHGIMPFEGKQRRSSVASYFRSLNPGVCQHVPRGYPKTGYYIPMAEASRFVKFCTDERNIQLAEAEGKRMGALALLRAAESRIETLEAVIVAKDREIAAVREAKDKAVAMARVTLLPKPKRGPGNPHLAAARILSAKIRGERKKDHIEALAPHILAIRMRGITSAAAIAKELNAMGIMTPRGRTWSEHNLRHFLQAIERMKVKPRIRVRAISRPALAA